jgi:hypothetical protein
MQIHGDPDPVNKLKNKFSTIFNKPHLTIFIPITLLFILFIGVYTKFPNTKLCLILQEKFLLYFGKFDYYFAKYCNLLPRNSIKNWAKMCKIKKLVKLFLKSKMKLLRVSLIWICKFVDRIWLTFKIKRDNTKYLQVGLQKM